MARDLKKIYNAATLVEAEQALADFALGLGRKVSDDLQDVADPLDRQTTAAGTKPPISVYFTFGQNT